MEATTYQHESEPVSYGFLAAFYDVFEWALVLSGPRDLILKEDVGKELHWKVVHRAAHDAEESAVTRMNDE